jgi:hypothetical protein
VGGNSLITQWFTAKLDPEIAMEDNEPKPSESPNPSVQSPTRQGKTKRPWDRYDVIGAAIVAFLVALWVLHFLLPPPPPTVP